MEETLGKRIVKNRKRLAMTQDALAEKLGVTAQAVSKWENDQSCPDISTLPKLAAIFGITTDALLGVEPAVKEAEVVTEEVPGIHIDKMDDHWEFHWDGGRKSYIGLALWMICTALMLLAAKDKVRLLPPLNISYEEIESLSEFSDSEEEIVCFSLLSYLFLGLLTRCILFFVSHVDRVEILFTSFGIFNAFLIGFNCRPR